MLRLFPETAISIFRTSNLLSLTLQLVLNPFPIRSVGKFRQKSWQMANTIKNEVQ